MQSTALPSPVAGYWRIERGRVPGLAEGDVIELAPSKDASMWLIIKPGVGQMASVLAASANAHNHQARIFDPEYSGVELTLVRSAPVDPRRPALQSSGGAADAASTRGIKDRIANPSGVGVAVSALTFLVPFAWPLFIYMAVRYLTGHRPDSRAYASPQMDPAPRWVAAAPAATAAQPKVESVPAPAGTKVCPRCAEDVKAAALVCRYCSHEFETDAA
jgi:hypothetical protein